MLQFFYLTTDASPETYTLSLHDALPISASISAASRAYRACWRNCWASPRARCSRDRKSTRLNSSHRCISYAVFCLKKKKQIVAALVEGNSMRAVARMMDVSRNTDDKLLR